MQRMRVQALFGEIRSHVPCCGQRKGPKICSPLPNKKQRISQKRESWAQDSKGKEGEAYIRGLARMA